MSSIPDRIARRREQRRRRLRRRRLVAAAVTATAGLAIAALAAGSLPLTGGGGDSDALSELLDGEPQQADADGGAAPAADGDADRDRARWRLHPGPVPVIMYHALGEPPVGAPYPDLFLDQGDFRAQIAWLARNGYEAVTMREVEQAWWRQGELPLKPVVLSFDDGYVSQYEIAFRAMRRHGWPGLLNLKAGETDIYKRQVREMLAAGWELGSHTINHPDLTGLDDAALAHELSESRRLLRREFGVPVTHLCYPAGRHDDRVVAAAAAAGYSTASTTEPGLASREQPHRLRRVRINRGDGAAALATALASLSPAPDSP